MDLFVSVGVLLLLLLSRGSDVLYCTAEATTVDLGGELPFMATAFVQTGNELHYFSDVQYHETLVSTPIKRCRFR